MGLEDGDEKVQMVAGKREIKERPCRVCRIMMHSGLENRIGLHIRCAYNANKTIKVVIGGPSYGRRRQD